MNPARLSGPGALALLGIGLAGCGQAPSNDGRLFQRMADTVRAIRLDEKPDPNRQATSEARAPDPSSPAAAQPSHLGPPMKIELLERSQLSDARNAGLRAAVALVDSQFAGLRRRIDATAATGAAEAPAARAAVTTRATARIAPGPGWVAQLAAFSSRPAAEAGWARLKAAHGDVLASLAVRFQSVDLGSRGVWTRVQTAPLPTREQAEAVCAGVRVAVRWCVVPVEAGARA